jgi:hypothetical protein
VCEREGTRLRALVEQGLRRVIDERARARPFTSRQASFKGTGLNPAVAERGWERIRELAYEGRA